MKKNRPVHLFIGLLIVVLTLNGCSLVNRQQSSTPTAETEIYLPVVPSGENLEDLPSEADDLSTVTLESSFITTQET